MNEFATLISRWNTPDFEAELLRALKQLDTDDLPLKQLAQYSGLFDKNSLEFSVLSKRETEHQLIMKLGVFYQEISSMCPCTGDGPETAEGHCEMQMSIDKQDASVAFIIL